MSAASIVGTASGPVEVWAAGAGPAVMFVHGRGFGGSWRNYAWVGEQLSDHHVITISRPGYGNTPLNGEATFGMQAELFVHVLDSLGVSSATIAGVSAGGPSAMVAARDHSERFTALILCCASAPWLPPDIANTAPLDDAAIEAEIAEDRELFRRVLEDEVFARATAPMVFGPAELALLERDPAIMTAMRKRLAASFEAPSGFEGMRNDSRQSRAARISPPEVRSSVPALILHGTSDTSVPVHHARNYADEIPAAEIYLVEGAGHLFFQTMKHETIPIARAFLARANDT